MNMRKRTLTVGLAMALIFSLALSSSAFTSEEAEALYNEAYDFYKHGLYGKAKDRINKAIELDPDYADAYSLRGYINCYLVLYEEAMKDLNTAVKLDPNNHIHYFRRMFIFYIYDDYESALNDLSKAITLNPENSEYYLARGMILENLKRDDEAIEDYRKGCELGSSRSCTELQMLYDRIKYRQK
jgi:tetratricopeptide (TPR) repeat protein